MSRWISWTSYALILGLACLSAGCGSGRYPVNGEVTYEDGSPVPAGTVIGEATIDGNPVGVQGNISNGTFRWGGARPGDGALPGDYRVLIMSVSLGDSEIAAGKVPSVSGKYSRFESSGLTFTVKEETNNPKFTVTKPGSKSGDR